MSVEKPVPGPQPAPDDGAEATSTPRRRRAVASLVPDGPVRASVHVCQAAGCLSLGPDVLEQMVEAVRATGATDVAVKKVGCLGLCSAGPLAEEPGSGRVFDRLGQAGGTSVDAVAGAVAGGAPSAGRDMAELLFFSRQVKVALEHCGHLDPESLEDYVAAGGYQALTKAVTSMSPDDVINEVVASGLRGRGGAGYPTGLKWRTVAKASGPDGKYVICNADEGDPGAFMDRSVLESCPQQVLEGMAIAAYAVGANRGYVYVRAEYPLAVKRLTSAIRQAEREGFLGRDIAGSRFELQVEVRIGAGAFVCGEETALIASVQGGRGTPKPRPPYPAASGLWGCPTLINNVESFANIAAIIRKGGAWLASIGTEKSKGTKVFALTGAVTNTGLIEVPMGVTLRQIVFEIGGGVAPGRRFKAVQTGGPSGGCIPEHLLDMSVDYETLGQAGSIMGSGGMIVMDDTACMVDVAKYFMDFCREESCGKCLPCRVGTQQMYRLLDRISKGEARLAHIEQLEGLAGMVRATSLCGLGQGAPSPVFSTLRYFRDEYVAHVVDRTCPAGVCRIGARTGAGSVPRSAAELVAASTRASRDAHEEGGSER
ncbi:MAG TPA: NuoF family protein [Acidimicrobiales bacterium]|nr:NuoF family protein [Acidimicrobiales bacterium]